MRDERASGRGKGDALPTGTVSFLFTDIEGSTQRWDANRVAMTDAVRRHDTIGRAAIEARGGYIFKTLGDAFCAAFSLPEEAVVAAVDLQRAFAAEDFADVAGLRIRAAIHTGATDERDGDYFGPTVNRVARLLAIAHGGQIVVSGVTQDLALGAVPAQIAFKDLGAHRLKDLSRPEQVYQVVAFGIDDRFLPLRSLSALPNNLPMELTSFVGREREVGEIVALLAAHRLVTLVGSGGIGKTRTSLQVAANLLDGSGDGVWFVELAPLTDGALIPSTIASALGLTLSSALEPIPAIVSALAAKVMLLVFDNCEHLVVESAAVIAAILRGGPGVKIVASSRQNLGIAGETAYRLPSLELPPVPKGHAALAAAEASRYAAVVLFVDRARAADTRFELTDDNASAVIEIVQRLDGIALAIELAASRVKMIDVHQLAKRLDERFRILTGGGRDALPRQQTLRALIDWSYDLVDDREKRLFQRVGIFVDGFTMKAAVAVCCDDGLDEFDLFDVLGSLVDKSLVVAELTAQSTRYRLLETSRAYALEKLVAAGDRARVAERHVEWIAALADDAFRTYAASLRDDKFNALEAELDNFRAAVNTTRSTGDIAVGAQIVANTAVRVRTGSFGSYDEIFELLTFFSRALPDEESATRARLLTLQSRFLGTRGRVAEAIAAGEDAVRHARESGDRGVLARALHFLTTNYARVRRVSESQKTFAEFVSIGGSDVSAEMYLLALVAEISLPGMLGVGTFDPKLIDRARAKCRALGVAVPPWVLHMTAEAEFHRGNVEGAIAIAREALSSNSSDHHAGLLQNLAGYLLAADDVAGAREAATKSLELIDNVDVDSLTCVWPIEHLALACALEGDAPRAARLLGHTTARLNQNGRVNDGDFAREPLEHATYERLHALLAERLTSVEIANYEAEGCTYTPRQAREEAIRIER